MKTNLSLRRKPGPPPGRGGRRKKKNPLSHVIRVSEEVYYILESERKQGERPRDTVKRIILEKGIVTREYDKLKSQF